MTINYQQPYGFYNPYGMNPYQSQQPFMEQSYIENILRLNLGKMATIYMNFEGSQWGSKVYKGELIAAGKDHHLSYITFEEELNYEYPFQ